MKPTSVGLTIVKKNRYTKICMQIFQLLEKLDNLAGNTWTNLRTV